MILESAPLQVRPGQAAAFESAFREAQAIISSMPGYLSHELQRCLEREGHYLLLVRWESVEAHEAGFRKSAGYQRWKALLHHFYDPFPVVNHYERVEGHPGLQCRPHRLHPGDDLRKSLEALGRESGGAFVVGGVGSLESARIRLANAQHESRIEGPCELLSLSGSLSSGGAHLHMSVADAQGRVTGGHVCPGNIIRTTAEVLVAALPAYEMDRALDPATGYKELVIRRKDVGRTP